MFKVSKSAAAKIRGDAALHDEEDFPLRIAASRDEQGAIHYQIGYDNPGPQDMMVSSRGVDIVMAPEHKELLSGCELDYVKLEDGDMHFIFLNPNDPEFVPPTDGKEKKKD